LNFYSSLWEKTLTGVLGPWFSNSTNWIVRVDGALNIAALQQAIDLIVTRHRILCCWVEPDELGYRFVSGARSPLYVRDLSPTSDANDADALRRHVSDFVWNPFAAAGEPLFRSFVMHAAKNSHILGFVVHHFIADSVSVATIADEITHTYSQILRGVVPVFGATPLQYMCYVHACNEWLQGGGFRIRLAYWRKQLWGANSSRLPPSRDADANDAGVIRVRKLEIDPISTKLLRQIAAEQGTTLYVLLLAAKAYAMFKFDGAGEHLILAMHDGRDDARLRGMVGSCQNQLLLRISHSPGDSFLSTIDHVHQTWFAALEHQVPYHYVRLLLDEFGIEKQFTELNAFDAGDPDVIDPQFSVPVAPFAINPAPSRSSRAKDFGITSTMILAGRTISMDVLYLELLYNDNDIEGFMGIFEETLLALVAAHHEELAGAPNS
jgi:hypothetical protein